MLRGFGFVLFPAGGKIAKKHLGLVDVGKMLRNSGSFDGCTYSAKFAEKPARKRRILRFIGLSPIQIGFHT